MEDKKEQLEKEMSEALEQGEMKTSDPQIAAVRRLIPPYEVRIKAERDPIVEETKTIRSIVREPDCRYDAYMEGSAKESDRS